MYSSVAMNKAIRNNPVYGPFPNFEPPDVTSAFDMNYRGSRGVMGSKLAAINSRLSHTAIGRSIKMGTMESFGWHFEKGQSQGFLGLKSSRLGWGTLPKSLGILSTAAAAYSGYQEEGVWGAAKGIGTSVAFSSLANYAISGVGGASMAMAAPAIAIAAAGYGAYRLHEAGKKHAKSLRQLEMGGGDQIMQTINTAETATMRQRALLALNNTHINGRMALGNEAFLMHRGFSA